MNLRRITRLSTIALFPCLGLLASCEAPTDSDAPPDPFVIEARALLPAGTSVIETHWTVFLIGHSGLRNRGVSPTSSNGRDIIMEVNCAGLGLPFCEGEPMGVGVSVAAADGEWFCGIRTGFSGRPGQQVRVEIAVTADQTLNPDGPECH